MVETACEAARIDAGDYRFNRRDVRTYTGWTDFQIRTHLKRLVELEYVLVHRGGRGQSFVYELLYDGQVENAHAFMSGLLDIANLKTDYAEKNEPPKAMFEGASSPQRAAHKPLVSTRKTDEKTGYDKHLTLFPLESTEQAPLDKNITTRRSVAG